MPANMTNAERDEHVKDLRDRIDTVEDGAALDRVDAMEWDSNPGQCTGVEIDPSVHAPADSALESIAAVYGRLADAKTEYATVLRRIARQLEGDR